MVLSNSQMEYILHLFLGKEKITLIALNMLSLDVISAFADGGHKRSQRIKGLSKPPYQDSGFSGLGCVDTDYLYSCSFDLIHCLLS